MLETSTTAAAFGGFLIGMFAMLVLIFIARMIENRRHPGITAEQIAEDYQ